jgi:hypothetical protein
MISNKYVRENREKRNVQQKEYAEWVLSQPDGVTANQVREHFKKLDTNSVRTSLQRAPNVYIAYWNRATKGHPQAIFKAVKEGDPVPESAKSLDCFNAVDNRLLDRGYVRQGLTVIRGPWPSNNGRLI